METFLKIGHPVLAALLLVLYFLLSYRFFKKGDGNPRLTEVTLAQAARIFLLLIYLTGLIMSMNLKIHVYRNHHYASILPVFVIFIFQFLPGLFGKQLDNKGNAMMFLSMLVAILIISITALIRVSIRL